MATIVNCLLRIAPDPLDNQATIIATCDIEFTDFEMQAMNLLELQYAIDCRVLNKDLWYEAMIVALRSPDLCRVPIGARNAKTTWSSRRRRG